MARKETDELPQGCQFIWGVSSLAHAFKIPTLEVSKVVCRPVSETTLIPVWIGGSLISRCVVL